MKGKRSGREFEGLCSSTPLRDVATFPPFRQKYQNETWGSSRLREKQMLRKRKRSAPENIRVPSMLRERVEKLREVEAVLKTGGRR